eukprot:CAMPEP_0170238548 /NCGR_PEP_ID=MMETSP0116_2-20130129/19029_1 /TAXON_ID=400756 /ORGANISM="Durinskia baltica, Strain CSIRO CS-38" /LENGTH=243 /DNA_ID=CAMNT_0010489361 /DNA_START=43 /DNA_END=774 /DNA_ORIENTATION=+
MTQLRRTALVVAALLLPAAGRFLAAGRAPAPTDKAKSLAAKATAHDNSTAKPHHASDIDELKKLSTGLKAIQNLRSNFAAMTAGEQDDGSKFANGALSEELGKKDSKVWATLQDMLANTVATMGKLKSKPEGERKKMMESLEKDLDSKAGHLMDLTGEVTKKQYAQDEEYLLGLLNMHRNWSWEQQFNATATFNKGSPVIAELYKRHDASRPLSVQLAELMDAAHATKRAAQAFIQLVDSLHQ